jgi:hypothetical protein
MSFRPSNNRLTIFNLALDHISGGTITDPDERGFEAAKLRMHYPNTVSSLLESFHWWMAEQRLALPPIENNNPDWRYAFQRPTDIAYIIALHDEAGRIGRGLNGKAAFKRAGNVIYTDRPNVVATFTSYNISEGDFSARFVDIVAASLGARVAIPIAKSPTLAQSLREGVDLEIARLRASELNEAGQTYGNGPTEAERARAGMFDDAYYGGHGSHEAQPAYTGY